MSDYEKQAQDFLDKTGTKFESKFNRIGKYFDDDQDERDIYDITLTRGARSFTFTFGQSVNHSGRYWVYGNPRRGMSHGRLREDGYRWPPPNDYAGQGKWSANPDFCEPTPYQVLACLQKYDPGTFGDFCADFGYDTDSMKALKTFEAVRGEYRNLAMLFNDEELELMAEIN